VIIMTKKLLFLAFVLIGIMAIAGCDVQQAGTDTTQTTTGTQTTTTTQTTTSGTGVYTEVSFSEDTKIETKAFSSAADVLSFIQDNQGGSSYQYNTFGRNGGVMMEETMAVDSASAPMVAKAAAGSAVDMDYSETNNQVSGVDEADIMKSDGTYIYTVSEKTLFIIKAYPGKDAEIVSTIKLDDSPQGIFVDDDVLAVFGSSYNQQVYKTLSYIPRQGMTFLNVYDISDRKNPDLLKEYQFEGSYFNGRMADGYMYILTNTRPEIRPIPMPYVFEDSVRSTIAPDHIHYYNIRYDDPMFVNIHAIDMSDPSKRNSESVVVEGSQNLYMSEKNIYVTYTEWINEYDVMRDVMEETLDPKLTDDDKALIKKVKSVDNDILSRSEKESKIYQVYMNYLYSLTQDDQDSIQDDVDAETKDRLEGYKYFEYTVINKISFDKGEVKPVANGKVPGSVNNQFSLDEKDDVLRLATTVNQRWSSYIKSSEKSSNHVFTLDKGLSVLDSLDDLAEGERIYSTRFIDDRLYMVTFQQVDPFFVIDLSDPEDIGELGQLKIPGFSRYLHPYDKDVIIGIGQDATETGRTKGLKISLFDVSDVKNPKEIAKYVTDSRYASSTALYEHKAFLFSKDKNLLVIPAYNYNYQDKSENYNGAFVFDIEKDKIELRGLIDHSSGNTQNYYYSPSVERSMYIEDLLYTKSPDLLRINELDDLSSVKKIDLDYSNPGIKVY